LATKDVGAAGSEIGKISVIISYRIIDLFSGHLYSSPTKAIEELVVNSYDAFAKICQVVIPEDWDSSDARILVFDDGDGMDDDGLRELWLIADCRKREKEREQEAVRRGRLPVGKFGIGKLASYVVGQRISHISKKDGKYLAVTMDYTQLDGRDSSQALDLPIRELNRDELEVALSGVIPDGVELPLVTPDSPDSWTLVIIDRLKEVSKQIKRGRLSWVISTALPLDPTFKVVLNGEDVKPSKIDEPKHRVWAIGIDDKVAKKLGYEPFHDSTKDPPFDHGIQIRDLGRVSGQFELYKPTITSGKAAEVGRSNGFFIVVRNRLVNLEDSLFGLHALSHQTFNRFRGEIYADGLDNYLVADREDVTTQGHELLSEYLKQKFYEARSYYEKMQQVEEEQWPEAIQKLPGDLVKYPLIRALDRSDREGITPWLIRRPSPGTEECTTINNVELEALETDDPVGTFETKTGTVRANILHPLRVNFPDDEGFKNWATVETMTEAYLLDAGVDSENIKTIMEKRDRLMRILVRQGPRTARIVAQNILETTEFQKQFETACARGFRVLGMDVIQLGKSGDPDGIATAHLGVSDERGKRTYSMVYDAKTTVHAKVPASNLNLSAHKRHQDSYRADFAAMIAPDYEGEGDDSAAVIEARKQGATLIRAKDFADLVEASAVKRLSLTKLRELFETCRSPDESHAWVQKFKKEPQPLPPIKLILQTIWDLQTENPKDPASFGAIKFKRETKFKEFSEKSIKEWLESLERLTPDLINVQSYFVELNQSPEIICEHLHSALDEMMDKKLGEALKKQLEGQE